MLLDTHTLLWFFQDDPRLSALARATIEDEARQKFISIVTCWEIAIKVGLGKLKIGEPTRPYLDRAISQSHFALLGISLDHATWSRPSPIITMTPSTGS